MPKYIDLHTHSTCSDGTLSPSELVDHAVERKLAVIALTDHDTVSGLPEALDHARRFDIEVVPGIEISSRCQDTSLHILGYGIDHKNSEFAAFLAKLQKSRYDRNIGILERINTLGIHMELAELTDLAGDQIGRPHFAQLLIKKGIVGSMQDAFTRFLKRGGPAFVEHARPESDEVIEQIRNAGGIAILAHPACTDPSLSLIPTLIKKLRTQGLAGLEAYYPAHSKKTSKALLAIAGENNMLVSGGTDFHGKDRSSTPLGGSVKTVRIPLEIWENISTALAA